jgi:hypothetical protein
MGEICSERPVEQASKYQLVIGVNCHLRSCLFDDLVGAGEDRGRDLQAEDGGGF